MDYENISTHTPLARRDPGTIQHFIRKEEFLLTRLSRGVTEADDSSACLASFLLTRLSRGVTIFAIVNVDDRLDFYSHASREA